MSARQMALEALKGLWIQKPGGGLNGDSMSMHCVDMAQKAIAALEAELAQVVAPVDCQFQGKDGRWNSFLNEQHKADTIADGTWPIRTLYAAPQAVNAELLELLEALQADAVTYLSDNDCGADWFVNRMLWHLDGPQQRAAQAALEAEIAHPVAPGTKQLTVQLHDEQKWTVAEQQQFAEFLKRFPNESSQGIMSLGDAWKHGKACAAPQEPAAPGLVNAEMLDAEPVGLRDAIATALASELAHDTYDCTRVWSAWQVGTMGEDDFSPIGDRLDEIVETVISAIAKAGGAA